MPVTFNYNNKLQGPGVYVTAKETIVSQRPQTWEAALIQLQRIYLLECLTPRLLLTLQMHIDAINSEFYTDIEFRTVEHGRIILFSKTRELIIPELFTRKVLIEKQ